MRGEYPPGKLLVGGYPELPPRARRIPMGTYYAPLTGGTTSACAENTSLRSNPHPPQRNYLRVRGEYKTHGTYDGKLLGTTSACAENTCYLSWRNFSCRNYLRVRGEYPGDRHSCGVVEELPPRARRILVGISWGGSFFGTTSACAENTGDLHSTLATTGNYLRVRGEYR